MDTRLDHELLLDYVEGELPAQQAARVETALREDPKLARLIEGLNADRAAMRSLANETAPPIVEDVLAGSERQMLLGSDLDQPDGSSPRARKTNRHSAQPHRRFTLGRLVGYAAAAATIALAGVLIVNLVFDAPLLETAQRWNNPNQSPPTPHNTPTFDGSKLARRGDLKSDLNQPLPESDKAQRQAAKPDVSKQANAPAPREGGQARTEPEHSDLAASSMASGQSKTRTNAAEVESQPASAKPGGQAGSADVAQPSPQAGARGFAADQSPAMLKAEQDQQKANQPAKANNQAAQAQSPHSLSPTNLHLQQRLRSNTAPQSAAEPPLRPLSGPPWFNYQQILQRYQSLPSNPKSPE